MGFEGKIDENSKSHVILSNDSQVNRTATCDPYRFSFWRSSSAPWLWTKTTSRLVIKAVSAGGVAKVPLNRRR
jgi:hypothetical protein